jgi:formamidopyrimidine-DNA glycosylase
MPEVVEVCLTALWLNNELQDKRITEIKILNGRYSRHPLKGLDYFEKYKPFKVIEVNSKGKFLWFKILGKNDKEYYILNRFGLEGEWGFTQKTHSGIEFTIKDGTKSMQLYFTDSRSFGTLEIVNDKNKLDNELMKLGPDFLKVPFTNQEFYARIEKFIKNQNGTINNTKGNKEIIKVLMDQTNKGGFGCGLGNYLSVEALYDAKISPYKKIKDLYENKDLAYKLAKSIKYITKLSYMNATIGYLEYLDKRMASFIIKLREKIYNNPNHINNYHLTVKISKNDKFIFRVYRQKVDPLGNNIKGDKIIPGRTTYWSPSVQL